MVIAVVLYEAAAPYNSVTILASNSSTFVGVVPHKRAVLKERIATERINAAAGSRCPEVTFETAVPNRDTAVLELCADPTIGDGKPLDDGVTVSATDSDPWSVSATIDHATIGAVFGSDGNGLAAELDLVITGSGVDSIGDDHFVAVTCGVDAGLDGRVVLRHADDVGVRLDCRGEDEDHGGEEGGAPKVDAGC